MAVPVHSLWDEEVYDSRNLWSLDFGDSRLLGGMLMAGLNGEIMNTDDTLQDSTESHVPTQGTDQFLRKPSAMQSIEPREDEKSWSSPPVLPSSTLTTVPLETHLETRNVGQDMTTSLKDQVQERAKADPRHISQQEKRRDAFIEIRLQQLDAEKSGAGHLAVPNSCARAEANATYQLDSHDETWNRKNSSALLQRNGPAIYPSVVSTAIENACIRKFPELSCLKSGSSLDIASGNNGLGSKDNGMDEGRARIQREKQPLQVRTWNKSPQSLPFTEMVWTQDMSPATQRPRQPRTTEDRAARLAVRRRGGACQKHRSARKACRCKLRGHRSEPFKTSSSCAPVTTPYSSPSNPPTELDTISSDASAPRQLVSRVLLGLLKNPDVADASAGLLHERLPELLMTAAELLETDAKLSTSTWLPVLRIAGTIFRSTETLASHAEELAITFGSRQLFCQTLFKVISLICNILSLDFPTSLDITRFLECIVEATNDLSHQLSIAGATENTELVKANMLKLWLDTTRRELQIVRSLLPEDTPVFTCPYPLAGCTYQTTDMQQWILHKDQCYDRRSALRTARPQNEANARMNLGEWRHADGIYSKEISRIICYGGMSTAVSTRPALRDTACEIANAAAGEMISHPLSYIWIQWPEIEVHTGHWHNRQWHWHLFDSLHELKRRVLFEAIYRIVWLELLRLFGLCMLSVLPLCTNMLGFVVCWLTILRSVSRWKCRTRSLLLV